MSLPYENATSGDKAISEIQKLLSRFGCQSFGHMTDYENQELLVQFKWRGKEVSVKASIKGYAVAWLKEHPYSNRMRTTKTEHETRAREQAAISVFSILRDWIKGQITAVETGIVSFEAAFFSQLVLPSGKTVIEHARDSDALRPLLEDKSHE